MSAGLGLPAGVRACLFDLDGVLTRTASVHAGAWKEMFDQFLAERARLGGGPFIPFDSGHDYDVYVDGLPRHDGTRAFLRSRGIVLPEGEPDDPPGTPSVQGLSSLKNQIVRRRIADDGVEVYEGSVRYVRRVRAAGLGAVIVSSSANTAEVLEVTGLKDLFDAVVDGVVARQRGLPGKPAPDMFLAGAAEVGAGAGECAVFEDAIAGVEAGHRGGFAVVVGVDRVGQGAELTRHGADVVVRDLADLLDGGR